MDISFNSFLSELKQSGQAHLFPNVKASNCAVTSNITRLYNCIAWAAEDTERWWWPTPESGDNYWPAGAPREETKGAFVKAFQALGYELCPDGELKAGYIKVAFYGDSKTGKPCHAARQLRTGKWTSKLGSFYDIEHSEPEAVCSNAGTEGYGEVIFYMLKKDKLGIEL